MEKKEWINRYFEGNLTNAELQQFEEMLQNDTTFAEEVAFHKNVKKAITLNEREALKNKLRKLEAPKANSANRIKWLAAACILIFAGILSWFMLYTTSSDDLYAEFYEPYPNTIAPTVRGNDITDDTTKAFRHYDAENYNEALTLFDKIYDSKGKDFALFYKGISLMELKRYDEAVHTFKELNTNRNVSDFSSESQWYLALCYLKTNNNEEAVKILKKTAEVQSPVQQKARELLAELE